MSDLMEIRATYSPCLRRQTGCMLLTVLHKRNFNQPTIMSHYNPCLVTIPTTRNPAVRVQTHKFQGIGCAPHQAWHAKHNGGTYAPRVTRRRRNRKCMHAWNRSVLEGSMYRSAGNWFCSCTIFTTLRCVHVSESVHAPFRLGQSFFLPPSVPSIVVRWRCMSQPHCRPRSTMVVLLLNREEYGVETSRKSAEKWSASHVSSLHKLEKYVCSTTTRTVMCHDARCPNINKITISKTRSK